MYIFCGIYCTIMSNCFTVFIWGYSAKIRHEWIIISHCKLWDVNTYPFFESNISDQIVELIKWEKYFVFHDSIFSSEYFPWMSFWLHPGCIRVPLNVKMVFYQYRNSHYKDKMVLTTLSLYQEYLYLERPSLYENGSQTIHWENCRLAIEIQYF